MVRTLLLTLIVAAKFLPGYAQADRKHIREGNKYFENKQFDDSEISYRKALEEESKSFNALFNLGDALYKQEKFEDAASEFIDLTQTGDDRIKRARSFHNLGNSLLKANKIQESIEAYKNSLRNDPADLETKYNLAYAQDLLKQQEQQQQEKNENQEDKKDQEQQEDQQDNKESQEQQEKNEQQSKPQDQEKQPSPSQQQQISKEDAQRLLEALENDEKKLLEKIKKSQARKKKVKTLKNW